MRFTVILICALISISSFSQDLISGFYQVSANENRFALKNEDSDTLIYLLQRPILILEDVDRIWSGKISEDLTYSITFKLNEKGAKKMKNFSQKVSSAKIALVI